MGWLRAKKPNPKSTELSQLKEELPSLKNSNRARANLQKP